MSSSIFKGTQAEFYAYMVGQQSVWRHEFMRKARCNKNAGDDPSPWVRNARKCNRSLVDYLRGYNKWKVEK